MKARVSGNNVHPQVKMKKDSIHSCAMEERQTINYIIDSGNIVGENKQIKIQNYMRNI